MEAALVEVNSERKIKFSTKPLRYCLFALIVFKAALGIKDDKLPLQKYYDMEDCDEREIWTVPNESKVSACMFLCKHPSEPTSNLPSNTLMNNHNMTQTILNFFNQTLFDDLVEQQCSTYITGRLPRLSVCIRTMAECQYRVCVNAFIVPDKYQSYMFPSYVLTTKDEEKEMPVRRFYEVLEPQPLVKIAAEQMLKYLGEKPSVVLVMLRSTVDELKNDWCTSFQRYISQRRASWLVVKVVPRADMYLQRMYSMLQQFRDTNKVVIVCGPLSNFIRWLHRTSLDLSHVAHLLKIVYVHCTYTGEIENQPFSNAIPLKGKWKGRMTTGMVKIFRVFAPETCDKDNITEEMQTICTETQQYANYVQRIRGSEDRDEWPLRHHLMELTSRYRFFKKIMGIIPRNMKTPKEVENAMDNILKNIDKLWTLKNEVRVTVYDLRFGGQIWPISVDKDCDLKDDDDNCTLGQVDPIDNSVFVYHRFNLKPWVQKTVIISALVIMALMLLKWRRRKMRQQMRMANENEYLLISALLKRLKFAEITPTDDAGQPINPIYPGDSPLEIKKTIIKNVRHMQTKALHCSTAKRLEMMPGTVMGYPVAMYSYKLNDHAPERATLKKLREMRAGLDHKNVLNFIGYVKEAKVYTFVFERTYYGTLATLLNVTVTKLEAPFKFTLLFDLALGMKYLHTKGIGYHGALTTSCCYMDYHMRLRIAIVKFYQMQHAFPLPLEPTDEECHEKLWTAPEILRHGTLNVAFEKADVYSFAIIMQEIVYQRGPFYIPYDWMKELGKSYSLANPAFAIVSRVRMGTKPEPFRPYYNKLNFKERQINELMIRCWNEMPNERPTFFIIADVIEKEVNRRQMSLYTLCLHRRMQLLTRLLHRSVENQLTSMRSELRETQIFLYKLFPTELATRLIAAVKVAPRVYTSTSIYFSDIVGFTEVSSMNEPEDICKMLDILFTGYDHVLSFYKVYPVTRIGDAYVLATGLGGPENARVYATEIAMAAIQVIHLVDCLYFSFLRGATKKLRIRTGIASGECVGGLVGELDKTPQFMVVGQLVTTAQSMEANSSPMRVLIEQATFDLLKSSTHLFSLLENHELEFEDGTRVNTFWLESAKWPIDLSGRLDEKNIKDVFREHEEDPWTLAYNKEWRED